MKGLVKIQLICPNTNTNNIEKASKGIFAYNRSSFNNYLGCEVLKCVFVPFIQGRALLRSFEFKDELIKKWLLLHKMIISQLELGPPVVQPVLIKTFILK